MGTGGPLGGPQGRGRPPPSWTGCGPLTLILSPIFFINSEKLLHGFLGHSENFYFCTKITPWQFCWKQRQSGLVPFKTCKLESKTRATVFGKVDTTETYQSVWWSIHSAPRSLPCMRFNKSLGSNTRAFSQALQNFPCPRTGFEFHWFCKLNKTSNISSQLLGFRILLRNVYWSIHNFFQNFL